MVASKDVLRMWTRRYGFPSLGAMTTSMIEGTLFANGLTTAIAINPNNSNMIYQGTAGGGVWRSLDGGMTWMALFDRSHHSGSVSLARLQ